ncbi:MAG: Hsp70 family protein [Candidatus Methanofastidiosia archaeon]
MDYALDHIQNHLGVPIKLNPLQKTILKETAEKAKIELSSKQKASIYIPGFLRREGGYLDLDISIDRKTFEELSKNLVERAIVLLRKALDSAHMEASHLDALLLLGGSSRIPYLRESIEKELGVMPFTGVDIETCVAQGAVIQAAVFEGNLRDVLLLDVVPSSYGIRSQGDMFSKLIERNTSVPTIRSQIFSTATDNQSEISVAVYQGENEKASQNMFLGTFSLTGIPPAPAGIPQIEVTFDIDSNLVIQVTAKDLGTSKNCRMKVEYPYGLDDAQISVMKKKVESWLSERRIAEIKSKVDTITALIEDVLTRETNALSGEDISALKECRTRLCRTTESGISYKKLENEILAAQSLYEKAHQKVSLYRKVTEDINNLIKKIEMVAPILRTYREEEARLLIQGRNLLEQYLDQNLSFDELHNIFSSVHSEYEVAASDLIIQALDDLAVSKDMKEWIAEIENIQFYPSLIFQGLQNLKEVKEVDLIVNLLELGNLEYRKSIQQRISEKIRKNSHVSAYFLLIYSVFVDFDVLSMVEELYDEKIGTLLAFTLFSALNSNRISQRVSGARIIAQRLPVQYLPEVVDYFSRESDNTVGRHLLDFVDKQTSGTLTEFFLNADHHIKSKIENSRELLLRLAKEPDERISFFALDSLAGFPEEEIVPILLSFASSENSVIRAKSLQILIGCETKDTRIEEIFIQAMRDPSLEIRLYALEFVEKTKKSSLIPPLFT